MSRESEDPLAGWDEGHAEVVDLAAWRARRSGVSDAAVVAGSGLVGALLGLVLLSRRRGWGVLLGALSGFLAGAAERRLWEGRW